MDTPLSSVIVVSSGLDGMPGIGKAIVDDLIGRGYQASYRNAADTLIPHLAGGALMIFGASHQESLTAGEYQELFRSLQGVNFAGRWGAFFTVGQGGVFKNLSAMVKDTDLRILEPGLVFSPDGGKGWKTEIGKWLSRIEKDLQGVLRKS
jgi:hypothetical protein